MTYDSYRRPAPDPEARTIRTPSAWPFTYTARALFGAPRPEPARLDR
jgi:hypothetical protein